MKLSCFLMSSSDSPHAIDEKWGDDHIKSI